MNLTDPLPALLLPSDDEAARQLIDEVAELARQEQAHKDFLANREKELAECCMI